MAASSSMIAGEKLAVVERNFTISISYARSLCASPNGPNQYSNSNALAQLQEVAPYDLKPESSGCTYPDVPVPLRGCHYYEPAKGLLR
jgi:hypothetical protein